MAHKLACKNCGSVTYPRRRYKGSLLIEVVLWLCFVIPGLLYTLWRYGSSEMVCAKCGSSQLVPLDSPEGFKISG